MTERYIVLTTLLTASQSVSEKLKVGSVIVNSTGDILSTGYNKMLPEGETKALDYNGHEINTIHAEQYAIVKGLHQDLKNCIIYCTHFPCINCAKLIIVSGIKQIVYINNYKNDPNALNLLIQSNVSVKKIDNKLLENFVSDTIS
jgi:dCMP deaminase